MRTVNKEKAEKMARAISLMESGLSNAEISAEMKCTVAVVIHLLIDAGVKRTPEQVESIRLRVVAEQSRQLYGSDADTDAVRAFVIQQCSTPDGWRTNVKHCGGFAYKRVCNIAARLVAGGVLFHYKVPYVNGWLMFADKAHRDAFAAAQKPVQARKDKRPKSTYLADLAALKKARIEKIKALASRHEGLSIQQDPHGLPMKMLHDSLKDLCKSGAIHMAKRTSGFTRFFTSAKRAMDWIDEGRKAALQSTAVKTAPAAVMRAAPADYSRAKVTICPPTQAGSQYQVTGRVVGGFASAGIGRYL